MALEKPLLIYDGDCNFCRRWIARWRIFTGDHVDYAPYQETASQYPQIPLEKFQGSVQLVEPDGEISGGAKAVFRTLTYSRGKGWLFWMYQNFPGFRPFSEWGYRLVAKNRGFFSFLTRFFWGNEILPETFSFSSWLFLRILGLIYFVAFGSLAVQLTGLVGKNGILPAQLFLDAVSRRVGLERFWFLPTLFWFNSSDLFLQIICWAGVGLAALLAIGIAEGPVLFLAWFFYLSLFTVCGEFLSFQWDILLLETGFLAIFLSSPETWTSRIFSMARPYEPSRIIVWLFRWLLFRLIFFSGAVKLESGDPAWRDLTALTYHYETQPLPTWIGWYLHQLPATFQKFSALVTFVSELAIPFLVFAPKRLRLLGCAAIILFQILIMATGNYCFFNLLTIALSLLLIDDRVWPWNWKSASVKPWPRWVAGILAGYILLVSGLQFDGLFRLRINWPLPLIALYRLTSPFQIVNSYGLFAVMTTKRPEIIVEGSRDQATWIPYEFKWKPGDLKKRPGFVEPHQPRLDWQMWFAALGSYQNNPWLINFCIRLLEGSPEVLKLLKTNPFPDRPPRFIRAMVYEYHFTNPATLKSEGAWWRRELKGSYCPILSLENK